MRLLAALLLASTQLGPKPTALISQGNGRIRAVAITFDAGADRGFAPRILRTLEHMHVHVSFGMTGRWAQMNPDLVRRMARDRDTFINHTYDHRSFTGLSTRTGPLSRAQRIWEIDRANEIIKRLTRHSSKPYFRPPYGDYDAGTLTLVRQLGYRYVVMWTIDSGGWQGLTAPVILARCLAQVRPGAIIAMHVGSQSQDAFALAPLIRALRHRHYRLVTIPHLLRH